MLPRLLLRVGVGWQGAVVVVGSDKLTAVAHQPGGELPQVYVQRLGALPRIAFMPEPPWGRGNCWLTCLTVDPAQAGLDRETLRRWLRHWPNPWARGKVSGMKTIVDSRP